MIPGIGNILIQRGAALPTGPWVSDSGIISGLPDLGYYTYPAAFYYNGDVFLIVGNSWGQFVGYIWNGSSWDAYSAIVSGLPSDIGTYATPTVFLLGSELYLITGEDTYNTIFGYKWSGSTWETDSNIISGISTYGKYRPKVFEMNSEMYLIGGDNSNNFYGKKWNGAAWVTDSGIIAGLPFSTAYNNVTVIHLGNDTFLIWGEQSGIFYGRKWNGLNWAEDSSIITGLQDVGTYSTPMSFWIGPNLYLISGNWDGYTLGYKF